jgi:hypothetical protein
MKMDRKYVNRRRWVAFIFIGIPLLLLGYYIMGHIWWTGTGYCINTMEKCVGL